MTHSVQGEPSSNFPTSDSTPKWKYDVFLSFAGQDTRLNFADHLYAALVRGGIRAFRDDEGIQKGEVISQQLLQAIEDSLSALVILSENYANSTWCLDELQKILECENKFGRLVIPIFYGIDPSDVRHQRKSFGEALAKHEERFRENKDKVQNWRDALSRVSNLSGWDSRGRHEADLIQDIVWRTWTYLSSKLPSYSDNLVGIKSKMAEMISLLEIGMDHVCFVGMWGMGGIGKTTLARLVYEKISNQFEMCCFLANVREASQKNDHVHLQREILSRFKIDNMEIKDQFEGMTIIRYLFGNKRVLLVLDDINDASQLENLAGSPKWFGAGSRIIITTRDIHLLTSSRVQRIYKYEAMKEGESLQLFSKRAFYKDHPEKNYSVLSKSMVKYAGGLPLALHVLGSFLCGRSIHEWEDALDRLKRIPNDNILQRLKISYDALNDEEKAIFLDIACFFKGWKKDKVIQILKICDLHPMIGINILIEKALVIEMRNSKGECILEMHDLLQEMGRNIIFKESPNIVGKRSRLWNLEDINEVLKYNKGSEAIQAIVLHISQGKVEVHPKAFLKMSSLRLLSLNRDFELPNGLVSLPAALKVVQWPGCPLEALPLEIPLDNLVHVQMHYSKIKQLWKGIQLMKKLKFIDLSNSKDLTEIPDFSGVPNLEYLILDQCSSLKVLHPSLGQLKKLVEVNLSNCPRLEILPEKLENISLTKLDLGHCSKVSVLPEFGECMKKLSILDVSYTAITKLPESLGLLTDLRDLRLNGCEELVLCPAIFHENEALEKHDASETYKTEMTPFTARLSNHKELNVLTWNLPPIFGFELMSITELHLSNCGICDGSILNDFGGLPSLLVLVLGTNNFVNLPTGCFSNLFRLRYLYLNYCKRLESLPKLPPRLIRLEAIHCDSMEPLSDRQLWNMIASLDHEDRHQTQYGNEQLKCVDSKYLPQRDFVAIIPGIKMPTWFPNIDYLYSHDADGEENVFIKVGVPQHFRASEWSGVSVCLHLSDLSDFTMFSISWSSKAPEDDHYLCKQWAHRFVYNCPDSPHLCMMVLNLNEKTCWQHLRGHNNCLHIKLNIETYTDIKEDNKLQILGCGWRVLCKEEIEGWCNTTGDFNKITKAEVGTSQICLPDSVFDLEIFDGREKGRNRKRNESRAWTSIVSVWDIVNEEGIEWNIGDGLTVEFWRDRWLSDCESLIKKAIMNCRNERKSNSVVRLVSNSGDWNWQVLEHFLPPHVLHSLSKVKPPSNSHHGDSVRWKWSKNGQFSMKSTYETIARKSSCETTWKQVWKLKAPKRVKTFLWLLLQGRLVTNAERWRRGLCSSNACYWCEDVSESLLHVLRDCTFAKSNWLKLMHPNMRSRFFSLDIMQWAKWNLMNSNGGRDRQWNVIFAITCWVLWHQRNERIFKGKDMSNESVIAKMMAMIASTEGVGRTMGAKVSWLKDREHRWIAPETGWLKMNVDGAASFETKQAGCGGVCRNEEGRFVFGFIHNIERVDPLHAELWACLLGLKTACDRGVRNLVLETDSLEVEDLLLGADIDNHTEEQLIREIRNMMARNWQIRVSCISPRANNAADNLAKKALSAFGFHIILMPNSDLGRIMDDDMQNLVNPSQGIG